ncbi:hypothetical protein U9M48_029086 [Paspalum notatum var. saurae]|uniref:Aminotransferase-like plant mobile domain-containing protein n=1 Tax=Paspalum notatum var. saurae TaxID=547442 RepID=A0AAQ3U091_PASNO
MGRHCHLQLGSLYIGPHVPTAVRGLSAHRELFEHHGCLYLLQVWSWEHLPIGRPVRRERERDMEVVTGRIDGRYKRYTNELDCVTHRQVEWTPYYREEIEEAELSPLSGRDEDLWRAVVPLIFFVMVEYHIPTRVLRQFGRRQVVPPHTVPTDLSLHRKRRQCRYSETDWRITHVAHTGRWDTRQRVPVEAGEAHDKAYFMKYLRWLQAHTWVKLRPTADHRLISEVDSDEIDEHNTRTCRGVQPERVPIQDYVGQQLAWLTNEAGRLAAPAQQRSLPSHAAFLGPSSSRGWSSRRSRSSEDDDDDEDDDDGDRGLDVLFGS